MINPNDWNQAITKYQEATPFHTYEWGVVSKSYGHQSIFLSKGASLVLLVQVKSKIFGHRLIAAPYAEYGGPLAESVEDLVFIIDDIKKEASNRRAGAIELRGVDEKYLAVYTSAGFTLDSGGVSFEIDITRDSAEMLSTMRKNVRTEIHKLEREQKLFFEKATSRADVEDFYQLYLKTMHRHGSPPHAKNFFNTAWELLHPQGLMYIFFAVHEKKRVAAFLLFSYHTTLYHWASVVEGASRSLDAQTFLMWRVIEWGKSHGYTTFDMGRTRLSSPIYYAKSGWGGRERKIWNAYYSFGKTYTPADPSQKRYYIAGMIWRLLPRRISNFFGPLIAGQIGF